MVLCFSFGEQNGSETEDIPDEVVRDTVDLDETLENDLYHDADPGVGKAQGGYGSASLTECLGRLGAQTTSATSSCLPLWGRFEEY